MKISLTEDGSFLMEMTPEDACEVELQEHLASIVRLANAIEEHGASSGQRQIDRAGYWRYCEAERSLNLIAQFARESLNHIKWLDFPKDRTDAPTETSDAVLKRN